MGSQENYPQKETEEPCMMVVCICTSFSNNLKLYDGSCSFTNISKTSARSSWICKNVVCGKLVQVCYCSLFLLMLNGYLFL
jgi:hypothetical protein